MAKRKQPGDEAAGGGGTYTDHGGRGGRGRGRGRGGNRGGYNNGHGNYQGHENRENIPNNPNPYPNYPPAPYGKYPPYPPTGPGYNHNPYQFAPNISWQPGNEPSNPFQQSHQASQTQQSQNNGGQQEGRKKKKPKKSHPVKKVSLAQVETDKGSALDFFNVSKGGGRQENFHYEIQQDGTTYQAMKAVKANAVGENLKRKYGENTPLNVVAWSTPNVSRAQRLRARPMALFTETLEKSSYLSADPFDEEALPDAGAAMPQAQDPAQIEPKVSAPETPNVSEGTGPQQKSHRELCHQGVQYEAFGRISSDEAGSDSKSMFRNEPLNMITLEAPSASRLARLRAQPVTLSTELLNKFPYLSEDPFDEEYLPDAGPAETEQEVCGMCKKPGHEVIQCWDIGTDGFTHGCAVCNSGEHETDKCQHFPQDVNQRIDIVVKKRACLPPLKTAFWYNMMWKWVKNNPDVAIDHGFPWTTEFAIELLSGGIDGETEEILASMRIDPRMPQSLFIKDPATETWEKVKETYGSGPKNFFGKLRAAKGAAQERRITKASLDPPPLRSPSPSPQAFVIPIRTRSPLNTTTDQTTLVSLPKERTHSSGLDTWQEGAGYRTDWWR